MNSRVKLAVLLVAFVHAHLLSRADEIVTQPFQGITLIKRTTTAPRKTSQHIVKVDLTAPGISFKVTPHRGPRDTVRETTLDFLNRQHAQVAVNAHFFAPFPSADTNVQVVGLAASEGEIYSPFEPQPVERGLPDQSFAIVPFAPALNIDRSNRVTVVHYDSNHADNQRVAENIQLWNAVSGSAQIVSNGTKTIPAFGPGGLKSSRNFNARRSWYSLPRARTAIGVTSDQKTLVIFTVDQRGNSQGMSVEEVADALIRDFSVANALNLDGGGSTTLAVRDPRTGGGRIINKSSDNPAGRAVGSNLAVFAHPNPTNSNSQR
jgi:exopolysaccharide biosynthesis protein